MPHRPAEVEASLEAIGLTPSRRLGQSFLVDPFAADALAAVAHPEEELPVYEVGGGLGIVTEALLRRGVRRPTVIEKDERLAAHLRRTFADRVAVVRADALSYDFPADAVVAGSFPYSVATPLVLALWRRRVRKVVGIVQREVAERFAAGPGSRAYGRPSILGALFGTVELYQELPAAAFWPRPKVASRLFAFTARSGTLPVRSVERLEELVRLLFTSRRKQLANLLPRVRAPGVTPEELAGRAGWPDGWQRLRPEALPPEAFFRLERALE